MRRQYLRGTPSSPPPMLHAGRGEPAMKVAHVRVTRRVCRIRRLHRDRPHPGCSRPTPKERPSGRPAHAPRPRCGDRRSVGAPRDSPGAGDYETPNPGGGSGAHWFTCKGGAFHLLRSVPMREPDFGRSHDSVALAFAIVPPPPVAGSGAESVLLCSRAPCRNRLGGSDPPPQSAASECANIASTLCGARSNSSQRFASGIWHCLMAMPAGSGSGSISIVSPNSVSRWTSHTPGNWTASCESCAFTCLADRPGSRTELPPDAESSCLRCS
jgi:hypothetical protein